MSNAVVLFTRDLRVHDQPALAEAVRTHTQVVPMYVLDDAILRGLDTPNRISFLLDALDDLRISLRERGADLIVRILNMVAIVPPHGVAPKGRDHYRVLTNWSPAASARAATVLRGRAATRARGSARTCTSAASRRSRPRRG
jgi:hypothetical protein